MNLLLQVSSFKLLLFISFCLLVNNILRITAYSKNDLDDLGKTCNASKADLEVTKQFEVPDSASGKCFVKCILTTLGLMNAAGEIDKEASIQGMIKYWPNFSSELNSQIAIQCYNEVSPNHKELTGSCELAYRMLKCLNVESRKHGYYQDFLKP